MATHKFTISGYMSDTAFRAVIAQFMTGLTNAGLVQTADTGQLNPATVTFPVSADTFAGFLIYRFNDTLQATKPIFLRIDVGRGTGANSFKMLCQMGTGSNGTGTLTGLLTANGTITGLTAVGVNDMHTSFIAGDAAGTGWVTMCYAAGLNSNVQFFSYSRSRDNLGVATNKGANACWLLRAGLAQSRYLDFENNTRFPSGSVNDHFAGVLVSISTSSNGYFQGEVPVFPIQPVKPNLDYPDLGLVCLPNSTDVSLGQMITTVVSGAVHKYMIVYISTGVQTHVVADNDIAYGLRCE